MKPSELLWLEGMRLAMSWIMCNGGHTLKMIAKVREEDSLRAW